MGGRKQCSWPGLAALQEMKASDSAETTAACEKGMITAFFKRPESSLRKKRQENAKNVQRIPRQASKQHMLRVNAYVAMLNDSGLREFQNADKLKDWNLLDGCQTGAFPEPMPSIPAEFHVRSLSVCTDQEATQITGGECIFRPQPEGLGCTGARFSDDFHRWNNDLSGATAKAGLAPVEKAATLVFNIGYGPWQSCAWFHQICSQGKKLAETMDDNSPLLLKYWPWIKKDRGIFTKFQDELAGAAARKRFVKSLPGLALMNLLGVRVAPSKWMSLHKAGSLWDDTLGARGLILGGLCMKKGWILTAEDLFSPTRLGATSCGDKPVYASKAAGVKDAQAKIDALKNRQQNNMATAARLLADIDFINGLRMVLLAGASQWTGFNTLIRTLTSPESCLEHCVRWSNWGWLDSLFACLDCLSDATGLQRCGIKTDFTSGDLTGLSPDSADVKYQNALAMRLDRFVNLIVSLRAGSLVERCHYYPFRLVSLTSKKPEMVKGCLIEFERDVRAWWAAKRYMGMQKIKDIVLRCRLGHPFEQWCIAFAAQASWKSVPEELSRLLHDTFSGWTHTRVNEKANKVWREVGLRESISGVVGTATLWEKLTANNVLGEFSHQEIDSTEALATASEGSVDLADLFVDPKDRVRCAVDASPEEIAAAEQENKWLKSFDRVLHEGGKTFTPETEQVLTAELRFLRTLNEQEFWHRANDAWLTSLLPVGGLIVVQSTGEYMWVLKTNECAALCWPAEQVELNMWRKARNVKELVWYTCFNLDDVFVMPTQALSPQSLLLQDSVVVGRRGISELGT